MGEAVTQQKHQEADLVPVVCLGEETRKEVITGQEATVTTVVVAAKVKKEKKKKRR